MPSSLHAQMTRRAISPRLATRIFLNMVRMWACGSARQASTGAGTPGHAGQPRPLFSRPDGKQFLSVLDGLAVGYELLDHFAGNIAFDFVHELHGLDDAQDLPDFNMIACFDEGRRPWRRRFVERAYNRGAHAMETLFGHRRRGRGFRGRGGGRGLNGHGRENGSRRLHREVARVRRVPRFGGALDLYFDVAALQFEFGDVLFD